MTVKNMIIHFNESCIFKIDKVLYYIVVNVVLIRYLLVKCNIKPNLIQTALLTSLFGHRVS